MRKIVTLFLLLSFALAGSGCSWFKHKAEVAKVAAIDCAKVDLGQNLQDAGMSVLAFVLSLITSDDAGWHSALDDLEKQVGEKATACALHVAEQVLRPDTTKASTSSGNVWSQPYERVRSVLDDRGWQFE